MIIDQRMNTHKKDPFIKWLLVIVQQETINYFIYSTNRLVVVWVISKQLFY